MNRKKLRGIIGAAIAIVIATNSTSNAAAWTQNEDSKFNPMQKYPGVATKPQGEEDSDKISDAIDTTSDEVISVIVEFVSEPLAVATANGERAAKFTEAAVERDHRVFEKFLDKMPKAFSAKSAKITNSYSIVYNGVALEIKASEVENLLNCGVVKRIHPNSEVFVDSVVQTADTREGVETNQVQPYMIDTVPFLDIDDLHDEGTTGKGVKVGVIDTGVDYTHPDLEAAYKGFKSGDGDENNQNPDSIKGWDFVDNDADPMETTYKDWKESGQEEFDNFGNAYYTSHGTHVSGTIAGQAGNEEAENPVLGVAPDVELYGYRVLGPRGSGYNSNIIAAIEKSVIDEMDVINLSLGNSSVNDPFDPLVNAVNNATLAGVVTVVANGNSGPAATTVGSPATSQLTIAVGASTSDFNYNTYNLSVNGLDISGELMAKSLQGSMDNVENTELEMVYCGLGYEEDFEGVDVNGKVAVIDRGDIAFVDKFENARNAGAVAAILVNNVEEKIPYIGEVKGVNAIAISLEDGAVLKENLDSKIVLTSTGSTLVKGDEVTGFSSVGPVAITAEIRPDVVAPGYQVYSTVPEFINDKNEEVDNFDVAYQRMSGTSMAAPHVAGIAALILQANPEYTPEDVKLALMNTSENIHQTSGMDYSVHQTGAGRVNPYEAVHENVTFKATYDVVSGFDKEVLENITGMLSYGKIFSVEGAVAEKSIPVTVTNDSNSTKTYNVYVEYSNSERSLNADNNDVVLEVANNITVSQGETNTFDAKICLPATADYGIYEGYIHFEEVGNESNTYQMPFSATYQKEGISLLEYPGIDGDYAKGLPAFNTSALFDKSGMTQNIGSDITFTMATSEAIDIVHTYVKDIETGEYRGYGGSQDMSWLPEGTVGLVADMVPSGKVKKLVDGNISHEEIPLETGIYELEVVAITRDGKEFVSSLPMAIINDTYGDEVSFDLNPGIIEVTEELYTNEFWFDGEEYEAIWLKANVFNEYVEKLKNEHGLDYLKQEELNSFMAQIHHENGFNERIGSMAKPNGDVMIAGLERSDFELNGYVRLSLEYVNAATIFNKPENFIFVNEGVQYLSIDAEEKVLNEDSTLETSLSISNADDIVKGSFNIVNFGNAVFNVKSVEPSAELQAILDENNMTVDVSMEKVATSRYDEEFNLSFEFSGDNLVGLTGDIKLFDIVYEVEEFKGTTENLMDDLQYKYAELTGAPQGEFFNSNNEAVDVKTGTIAKAFDIESIERTLIFGKTYNLARGMRESTIYAVDPSGNRYEPSYCEYNELVDNGYTFAFNELPIIDGDYKVIVETPGAFNGVVNVPGSKINKDGEVVGNLFNITSYTFTSPSGIVQVLGDVNGDGAIDIVDASEIAKVYKTGALEVERSTNKLAVDLNQDGAVNYFDMAFVLENYLKQDYSRDDAKTPEEFLNGNDIYDILESCGYFDEMPDMNVTLEIDKVEAELGENVTFTAIPPVDGVDFKYEFSIRGEDDLEWTVVKEKSQDNTYVWTPEIAGKYGVKVRIFLDEIEYVWQDNKLVTINDVDLPVDPEEPVDPSDPSNPSDPSEPSVPVNPSNPGSSDKPESDKDKNEGKLPNTGGAATLPIVATALTLVAGGAIISKKKK